MLRPGSRAWELELPAPADWTGSYGVYLWGRLEHPVDSRPSAFLKALTLALSDLPPPRAQALGPPPAPQADLDWMWKPQPSFFLPICEVWSRVRRYQPVWRVGEDGRLRPRGEVEETTLHWQAFQEQPAVRGERDLVLARAQAARLFSRS
ncbi:MAG: hypothetical protein U0931_14195 [Vulcanimicrobiota bacterium]